MEDRLSLDILAGGSMAEVNEVRLNKVVGSHDDCSVYLPEAVGVITNHHRVVSWRRQKPRGC